MIKPCKNTDNVERLLPNRLMLVRLFHLVSPSLPIGAYAYSQAFEWAVDSEAVTDKQSAEHWMKGVMQHSVTKLELPILLKQLQALSSKDDEILSYWNQFLLSSRETNELYLEDTQLGLALRRLLISLDIDIPEPLKQGDVAYASLFAVAAGHCGIHTHDCLYGFLWAWLENQVAAATKIIPLGQTQAQQLLWSLSEEISHCVENAYSISDEAIGSSLPGVAIASSLHETQYSRLFRS